jgi:glycosyltransferase involved in cell wall biosynthesis
LIPGARIGSTRLGTLGKLATHEARALRRLLPLVLRGDDPATVFICANSHYAALLAARVGGLLRQPTATFVLNLYLHEMGQRPAVRHILGLLMSGRVAIAVQSPSEVDYYRRIAPHADISLAPWGMGPIAALADRVEPAEYVFTGGYTNRDYGLLVDAARRLPEIPFLIACRTSNRLPADLPHNVTVRRDTPWVEFHHLLAAARLVTLPLRANVGSSGQMVTLAAMQAGKCAIYTDVPVVSQYFVAGETGVPCPLGDLDRFTTLIAQWYADEEGAGSVGRAARAAARAFSADAFESAVAAHAARFILGLPAMVD